MTGLRIFVIGKIIICPKFLLESAWDKLFVVTGEILS